MPENRTLFIVVSDRFRVRYLGASKNAPVQLAGDELVALAEPEDNWPDPWGEVLQELVAKEVEKHLGPSKLSVRVAAHVGPSFGKSAAPPKEVGLRDQRFPEKEELLKQRLGGEAGVLDAQVWGFHHDTTSNIWKALAALGQIIKAGADEGPKCEAVGHLVAAFDEAEAAEHAAKQQDWKVGNYEHARRLRHDILSLFSPLCLNLSTAAEREAAAGALSEKEREHALIKAKQLRDGVNNKLGGNLVEALELLKRLAVLVPGGEKNPRWIETEEKLKKRPDTGYEKFRQWNDGLADALAELVRWPNE